MSDIVNDTFKNVDFLRKNPIVPMSTQDVDFLKEELTLTIIPDKVLVGIYSTIKSFDVKQAISNSLTS